MWLRLGGRKVRARRSPPCLDDTITIAYSSMQYEYIHTYIFLAISAVLAFSLSLSFIRYVRAWFTILSRSFEGEGVWTTTIERRLGIYRCEIFNLFFSSSSLDLFFSSSNHTTNFSTASQSILSTISQAGPEYCLLPILRRFRADPDFKCLQ